MLAADKDRLIAGLKQNSLQLRQKELEYYIERYTNIATQASILAGFSFDALVELDPAIGGIHDKWVEHFLYASGSCAMACSQFSSLRLLVRHCLWSPTRAARPSGLCGPRSVPWISVRLGYHGLAARVRCGERAGVHA